jgi:hypothetical protein
MLLLCLIAAVSGTPLRQVEAAGDFVRSQAELGEDHVEMIDGGVGDDAEVAILKAGNDAPSFRIMTPLTMAGDHRPTHLTAGSLPGIGHRCPSDRAATLSPGSARCHAWLQYFLI